MPSFHRRIAVGLCLFPSLLATLSAQGQLAISEVIFNPVGSNTARQVVELRNFGNTTVAMQPSGYWLYFPPAQWQFPSGVMIAPGQTVTVNINSTGTNTATNFFTGISGMRNLFGQGSQGDAIGLFSTNLFADAANLINFVQWGGSGNASENLAVAAGIWPAGGFIEISKLREGSSIAHDGAGNSPLDWCIDGSPTLGSANDSCTISYSRSAVILNEVGYVRTGPSQYHVAVELKNTDSFLDDLAGKWIVLGGQHSYQFPVGTVETLMGPGEIIVLNCGVDGTNGQGQFYSGVGTFRDLQVSDSVSFHSAEPFTDSTTIVDFVQWGAANSPLEDSAVGAQAWKDGEFVDVSDRGARGSIAAHNSDRGASRWHIDNSESIGKENNEPPQVPVVINEVLIDPPGANQARTQVELKNVFSTEAVSLAGWKLCFESVSNPGTSRCYAFEAQTMIAAGSFLVVSLNRTAPSTASEVFTGPFQDLATSSGSILLLVSGKQDDPNNLIDDLRWGAGPGYGEGLATVAGIWTAAQSVGVTLARDGSSIAYLGTGNLAESYRIDLDPSLGGDNTEGPKSVPFRRGDCNDSGKADLSDAIAVLQFLFGGGNPSLCANACDTNNDEGLDISDAVFLLSYLFSGGPPPVEPGPDPSCAPDPDPAGASRLTCGSFLSCQ